ncbi:MAG: choice-of-anchor V domain-containing protein [Saprospiraceae bacterium]|nr:choice-of-anchor V domain-containing protein [Saprospiraceae bacterium]
MKIKLLYAFFSIALVAVLFLGNAGGAGASQNADRTGSPLSPAICTECHGGGDFAPTVAAQLLKGSTTVTQYTPGEDYTFRLTITATNGNPARYGFMAVALRGNDNANAGTWDSPPAGTRLTNINNRQYFEHSSPRNVNSFEIKWKAPAAGAGPVRFYAAGNAVNGTGSTDGDAAAELPQALVITEGSTSSVFGVKALDASILAYPNPVREQLSLNIELKKSGRYFLSIYDLNGKEMQRKTVQFLEGENKEQLNVQGLAAGHYTVQISDGERVAAQKILKK